MDLLDVIIIALLLFFAYSGWMRGLTWVGLSFVGLVGGVIAGTLLAPRVAKVVTSSASFRPTVTAGVFFGLILLIEGLGTAAGFRFRLRTLRTSFAEWDSILGSLAALVATIVGTWYFGVTFAQSRWTWVDHQIEGSALMRVLATVAPTEPGFLTSIQAAIANDAFSNPFSGFNPLLPDVQIPVQANTPGIRMVSANTAKVISYIPNGYECAGAEAGSGWAEAPDYLVTNAHVVAAGEHFEVDTPDGRVHTNVTVVLFDPNTDIAVLHVPGLGMTPLQIAKDPPAPATTGAVIGYPGGQGERIAPAAVKGVENAQGFNIYNDANLVTRQIVVIAGQVIPGNSGGPLVNSSGQVIGLVFADSVANPDTEGYALSVPQIAADLQAGPTRTASAGTGGQCAGSGG